MSLPTIQLDGVTKTILREGSGDSPVEGSKVVMHYSGWLKDPSKPDSKGAPFDSSVERGKPFETYIGVKQVIKGWDNSVITMKVGEKARIDIKSAYAYGARGAPPVIPPNSDLIFDVELLSFK